MPKPVAGSTQGYQVVRLIGATTVARHKVMNFEKPGPSTTGGLTTVPVAGKHLPPDTGRNGRGIPTAMFTDCGVATHSVSIGPAYFALAGVGLDGQFAVVFVDMNLNRRAVGEGPPGGLFRRLVLGGQPFQNQVRPVMRNPTQFLKPLNQGGPPRLLFGSQVHLEPHWQFPGRDHRGCGRQ